MKYYTIEISTTTNDVTTQAIYERESLNIAIQKFHEILSYNMSLDTTEKISVAIIDETLMTYKKETWEKPANS